MVLFIAVSIIAFVALMCARTAHKTSRTKEVIWVPESPMPSKSPGTPTPNRSALRAIRAGKCRVMRHRRWCTMAYNPIVKDDCAFMCVLKSASKSTSRHNIAELREQVARKFQQTFLENISIAGFNVKDVVTRSEHNRQSYLTVLRWNTWASPVEVAIVADTCKVTLMVNIDGKFITVGEGKRHYMMRLHNVHYTFHRLTLRLKGMHKGVACDCCMSESGYVDGHAYPTSEDRCEV